MSTQPVQTPAPQYTQWPIVVDALIDQLVALPGWRPAKSSLSGITVFDGPEVDYTADPERTYGYLVVGWGGDPETSGPESAGQGAQTPAALDANRTRDDAGTIRCRATYWTGDGVLDVSARACRQASFGIMWQVEQLLRSNPTLGIPQAVGPVGLQRMVVQFDRMDDITQTAGEGGLQVDIDFTVRYSCRI